MVKYGGARAKSGPAPKPGSGRSERRGDKWKVLPADGYTGPVPAFPMDPPVSPDGPAASKRLARIEARIWERAWSLPQGAAWADETWRIYAVAQWTRVAAICETERGTASDRTSMIRLQEEIGLTGPGMHRNGWVIGEAPPGQAADDTDGGGRKMGARKASGARARLGVKVIDGGRAG